MVNLADNTELKELAEIDVFRGQYNHKLLKYNKRKKKIKRIAYFLFLLAVSGLILSFIFVTNSQSISNLGITIYGISLASVAILKLFQSTILLSLTPSVEDTIRFRISELIKHLKTYPRTTDKKEIENALIELNRLYKFIIDEMSGYIAVFKQERDIKNALNRFSDVIDYEYKKELESADIEKIKRLENKFIEIYDYILNYNYIGLHSLLLREKIKDKASFRDIAKKFYLRIVFSSIWRVAFSISISLVILILLWYVLPDYRQNIMSNIFSLPLLIVFIERILEYSKDDRTKTQTVTITADAKVKK